MQPHDTDHGELVLAEMDGGVLRVTLNRPEKLNALTPPMSFRLAAT